VNAMYVNAGYVHLLAEHWKESVLFIGTQFGNLYAAVDTKLTFTYSRTLHTSRHQGWT